MNTLHMNFPQFLNRVEQLLNDMSQKQFVILIQDMLNDVPEEKRQAFLERIERSKQVETSDRNLVDEEKQKLKGKVEKTIMQLHQINQGELCLNSKFNPFRNYEDYWNDEIEDEYVFSDPHGIMTELKKADRLIYACIDQTMYEEGLRICRKLSDLKVYVEGEFDSYYGNELSLSDLKYHDLLSFDLNSFESKYLYLTYVCTHLEHRAERLYSVYHGNNVWNTCLLDFEKEGTGRLSQLDLFLPLWIDYLCGKETDARGKLLEEAVSLITDEDVLVNHVMKHADTHPQLLLQVLKMNRFSWDDEKILQIGKEALPKISEYSKIRSYIADLMASSAHRLHQYDLKDDCLLEAYRSEPDMSGYIRLKFHSKNPEKQVSAIREIMDRRGCIQGNAHAIRNRDYCTMLFFEQRFEEMVSLGLTDLNTAFLLCLLYPGYEYPIGMRAMINEALEACEFISDMFHEGFEHAEESDDLKEFTNLFQKWKESVSLSEKQKIKWLNLLDRWIFGMVDHLLAVRRPPSYDATVSRIAAYGELLETNGELDAKKKYMQKYVEAFPTRRKFHEEMGRYAKG